ncbi:hypothetical protein A2U01_0054430, partial [Trifolium medium]|nr:hypothetical protein [Trifolium medium]
YRPCLVLTARTRAASILCWCLGCTSKMPCPDRLGLETLFVSGA